MWEYAEYALFWVFAIAACGGAISVVISQNVVRMALGLIASLASVSALFFLLSADFVGATQLMVYVGGTVVLVIFGVMLTSSSALLKIKTSPADGVLAAGIGAVFLLMVAFTIGSVGETKNGPNWQAKADALKPGYNDESEGNTVRPLAMSFVGLRPDDSSKAGYLLPFEIVSVHLLVVLVGAAYLARAKRKVNTESQQT
ncbi:MAG: NADH-quinone oxidoreductase subunit J [Planctomycetes bacterium]|nr:NADH-quinone oxidoreductase subunit J [Planctomycetota bacterium]